MKTKEKSTLGIATIALLSIAAGCGSAPFETETVTGTVRFSLADGQTSAGLSICAEADVARLLVTPAGRVAGPRDLQPGPGDNCSIEYEVTVPKGRVHFSGELLGGGRPIMRGSRPSLYVGSDGFEVTLDLGEIDALDVRTETLGSGGPATYVLEVDGSPLMLPIDRDGTDTLSAVPGGGRFLTLHAEPCVVVNGPARRQVMIPTDEHQLGATLFQISCSLAGGGSGTDSEAEPPGTDEPADEWGTISVSVTAPGTPLPHEVTTFDVEVTDATGDVQGSPISVGNTGHFRVAANQGPFQVDLIATGTCRLRTGTSSRTVRLSSDLTASVLFDVAC